ncbi:uncharacterized protein Spt [Anoplolepis gracilipes]|uniref:uncharacterized protein Spt n=1 Tax=Anoplolepis gracilipes TaxID=354296 RepID=UPI003BA243E4
MDLKTKQMKKLLESLQQQISKLQLLLTNVSNSSEILVTKATLVEQLHFLTQRFKNLATNDNCDLEEENVKIIDTVTKSKHISLLKDIDEIIENINRNNIDKHITDLLLNNVKLALRALEDLECLPLKQRVQDCLNYVREMSMANQIEDLRNIKELGTSILELLEPLQKYRRSLISAFLSDKLALYSSQLCTSFEMLVHLTQEQHRLNAPIYACKKYICGRICTCCELILNLFDDSNPSQEEEVSEKENHFVYRMDLALDIILEMSSKTHQEQVSQCIELWLRLEDVFSHAMAIAQVCQLYNFNAITGSCQSIVMEYEKLKQQLLSETPDPSLNNLFMHTLTDALYRLERKINIAVLTLVMEVFGNPYASLKKLVMSCGNSLSAKTRSSSDLKSLIEDFDQLFDQTMQIGKFAIACCKNTNRNNKIRNCLAGFESLETELISAITSFYLHPDNKEMRSSVKLLTTQWQQEMSKFQTSVNFIINSAAFCEIIMGTLQERVMEISDCLDNRKPVTQLQVQGIVQRASALSSQITTIVNDIGTENIDRHTIMKTRELKTAIYEANKASKTLLNEEATEPQILRVIKRCELVLHVVKTLQPALAMIMNSTIHEKSVRTQGESSHGILSNTMNFPSTIYSLPRDENSTVYIRTPYTVKVHKSQVSIQPANSVMQKPSDLSQMIPYIKSGRTLRSEYSIMYNTPRKNRAAIKPVVKSDLSFRNLSNIRQHLFSRDSFKVHTSDDISEDSIDLTAVLKNISLSSSSGHSSYKSLKKISSENTSEKIVSNTTAKKLSETVKRETDSCANKSTLTEKVDDCTISGGGDASLVMETYQKLNSVQGSSNKIQKSTLEKHEM